MTRGSHGSDPVREAANPMPLLDQRARLPVLELTRSSPRVRRYSRLLLLAFLAFLVGVIFLPWQQFVRGAGRVVAYNPLERNLTVEAPLAGRVHRSHIVEGQVVRQGELLFELVDNDPELLANLGLQREAARARRDAASRRVESLEATVAELRKALPLAVEAAQARLDAANYAARTATLQYERVKGLYGSRRGLASQRDFELATLERDRTAADLGRAQAELERASVDVRSSLGVAEAQRDSAGADLAAADQALVALEVQVNQTGMQRVTSPRDGVVMRVLATEGTFLRAGTPLCSVVPDTGTRMAEVWVNGNDMPLIQSREVDSAGNVTRPGSQVRLQFEGWPAIQFVGWPSVAIGTFGGEVVLVDPTDDGKGKFRILVAEKPDVLRRGTADERVVEWPGPRWLRQGVRAHGWVLLQQVPLWFEFWRQLNGFPPALEDDALTRKGPAK
ncbi:MAG: HlyD family secretion protein [Candidatus Binatia bacterium]